VWHDILKFKQTSLFYSASYLNLWVGLGALLQRGEAHRSPPVAMGLCGKNYSLLFNAIDSEKYIGYVACQVCKICQTFCL